MFQPDTGSEGSIARGTRVQSMGAHARSRVRAGKWIPGARGGAV